MTDVGVVVGQLLRLLGDRLGDLFAAVADVHAVEAGEGVEQAGAVAVADVEHLAAGKHARTPPAAPKLAGVGCARKDVRVGKTGEVSVVLWGRRKLKKKKR